MLVARARVSRTGKYNDFTTLTFRDLGGVQSTLGVQRRDAVATGEEQLGRCAARKSKYIRLYMYSVKLILAATYLRRVFVDGRSFAAGAPALAHVSMYRWRLRHKISASRGQVCGGMLGTMSRIAPL
jgi:hypothetical protein